ncbi:hypothetical protein EZY14_012450 [Kordia sp. TARA_039_SRF]|nr:hypothetical protein EZY14_012450 [Kordia sp. TARA_039_SRF]
MTQSENDKWLMDAEVQSQITYEKGRWVVSLIFIDTKDPNRILIKKINDYRSQRLAEIAALHMKNTAAKDVRGTQKVTKDAYNFNNN